jgi:hypothetical protein
MNTLPSIKHYHQTSLDRSHARQIPSPCRGATAAAAAGHHDLWPLTKHSVSCRPLHLLVFRNILEIL